MSVPDLAEPDPCSREDIVAADGARVTFCRHGGHVLGWQPAGGVERLWLSRDTGCGPGTAIRGGIPVIWPQFAERGDGPRHGIARDRAWSRVSTSPLAPQQLASSPLAPSPLDDGRAGVRLQLTANAQTRALWPFQFTLAVDVVVGRDTLEIRLVARNDDGEPLTFTAALHTYLRVSSTQAARVDGLRGLVAEANDDGAPVDLSLHPLAVSGPIDIAIRRAAGEVDRAPGGVDRAPGDTVTVVDPVLGDVVVTADGFDSWVVWNPGPGRAPRDVHPGGEAEFVCVEPALLTPRTLLPGEAWTGRQILRTAAPL